LEAGEKQLLYSVDTNHTTNSDHSWDWINCQTWQISTAFITDKDGTATSTVHIMSEHVSL